MQSELQELVLLGQIPGTNIQLSLEAILIFMCLAILAVEFARLYIYHYHGFRARQLDRKAHKLMTKHGLF